MSDEEDFSSTEAEETMPTPTSDDRIHVDKDIQDEILEAASETITEETAFSSTILSDGYKTTAKPQMSESLCEPSLHSMDKSTSKSTTQRRSDQTLRLTPRKMKAEYYWALLR